MSLPGLRFVVREASGRKEPTWMSRMPLRGHEWLLRERGDCVSESGWAGSAGVPPAKFLERGKQAKMPMFSIISHPAARLKDRTASFHFSLVTCHCARRALRHPAAPLRMGEREGRKRQTGQRGTRLREGRREGGQFSEKATWTTLLQEERGRDGGGSSATKGTKGEGRRAGGGREERYTEVSGAASRIRKGLVPGLVSFPHAILCSVVDSPWHHMAMAVRVENRLCQHDCP